jgi:hypothetical protein
MGEVPKGPEIDHAPQSFTAHVINSHQTAVTKVAALVLVTEA